MSSAFVDCGNLTEIKLSNINSENSLYMETCF